MDRPADDVGIAPEPWGGWRLLAVLTAVVVVLQLTVGALVMLDGPQRDWELLAWGSAVTGVLVGPLAFLAARFVYGRRLTNLQLVSVLVVVGVYIAVTGFVLIGLLFTWWLIPPLLFVWALVVRLRSIEEQVLEDAE